MLYGLLNWKVEVPTDELIAAATERLAHHRERTGFWNAQEGQGDDLGDRIESTGVEAFKRKAQEHEALGRNFSLILRFLERAKARSIAGFELTPQDMEQFGL